MNAADLVHQFLAAIERKDLDAALALVTDDCTYDNVPIGAVHGPDGIRSVLGPFLAPMTAVEWVVLHEATAGDVVLNERLDRFQRPDGTWLELPVAGVFQVTGDRISLWRDYFDQATLMNQL